MAKKNKKTFNPLKLKSSKEKKLRKDPRLEEVYEQEVEFTCPIRGKVKQRVKIKKYKTNAQDVKHQIQTSESIDLLEERDNGLSIYNDGEELGITETKEE